MRVVKGLFPSPTPPPPDRGILLGFSQHPTDPSRFCLPVYWQFEQRPRHAAVVGGAGMGKSMLLRVIMRQDIEQGNGFALFDPTVNLRRRFFPNVPATQRRWKKFGSSNHIPLSSSPSTPFQSQMGFPSTLRSLPSWICSSEVGLIFGDLGWRKS
jgi:hypothetical protein